MAELSSYGVGQTIELSDGRVATIKFLGSAHFAPGDWIGIELEDDSGKNDGSIQGERYFDCEAGRGMFCRPGAVAQIIEEAPKPVPKKVAPKTNGVANGKPRPSSGVPAGFRRTSVLDSASQRRATVNAGSPTPGARVPGVAARALRSPVKSPTKQLGSDASSGTSTPRTTTPSTSGRPTTTSTRPRPSVGNRTSMGPPPLPAAGHRATKSTFAGISGSRLSTTGAPLASRTAANRLSLRPGQASGVRRLTSATTSGTSQGSDGSGTDSPDEKRSNLSKSPPKSGTPDNMAKKSTSPVLSRTSALSGNTGTTGRSSGSPSATRPANAAAVNREVEDLKTKLRMMEKRRAEDREKLKALDKLQTERDKFEGIVQKLQKKYQPQQQEITELRKQLKEADARVEEIETQQAEHDIALEMATLDREMAEESAEVFRTELEALKQRAEELELEVEILREENQELGNEMSPEEKASQGWLQMERNNERLREALIRLRDMTQQQEAELRSQIKNLESDVQEMSGIKEQYEATKEKLQQSEAGIEDLRQQLDTALGAEEMIEELTEKNMNMSEEVEELKATIEDLESLKELNDELEINHVETEKQMQEEIDYKDAVISEHGRKVTQQDETMADYEYTVGRFRKLVTNLQSDLEDMKSSQQLTENEAEDLTSRSRAMMDLNMKLQVSAAKTQVKTIDLELRRLDAQEAAEHLAIVQLFLPDAFHNDRDSVLALLRFRRVGFKSNLLHGFVKERVAGNATGGHEDDMFAACDVLDKLAWVSAMCDRFITSITSCSVEQFAKFEGALYELEPVERALNGWIDGLRRDELKEKQCSEELSRTMALMSHLAETHILDSLESYAEDIHMRALLMQSNLESAASALGHLKATVQAKVPLSGEDGSEEEASHFSQTTDSLVSQSRSAKVIIGKTIRSLEELKSRSLSLSPDTTDSFDRSSVLTQQLAATARDMGISVHALVSEEARTEPLTYSEVERVISGAGPTTAEDSNVFNTLSILLRNITNSLVDLGTLSTDLTLTIEFERAPPPWLLLSRAQKATKVIDVNIEADLQRTKSDLHTRATEVKVRDQRLEESAVKIELLESRMRDASKKTERIAKLEARLDEGKGREKDFADVVDGLDAQVRALESERDALKKDNARRALLNPEDDDEGSSGALGAGARASRERAVATQREMDMLQASVTSLQSAVRFLREDNRTARLGGSNGLPSWLVDEPLTRPPPSRQAQQNLLRAEGKDVLGELLTLASSARPVQLKSKTPADWARWRPARESTAWQVRKQREDWEGWKAWVGDLGKRGEHVNWGMVTATTTTPTTTRKTLRRNQQKKQATELARFNIRVPGLSTPGKNHNMHVRIEDPDGFEDFRRGLDVAV